MISTPSFDTFVDVDHSIWNDPFAQNSIDTITAQQYSPSFTITDPLNPPAANLALSIPTAQRADPTRQPSFNAPTLDGLHDLPEAYEYPWPRIPDVPNNIIDDWTYHCFNREGQLENEIRAPIPITPKPPIIEKGTMSSEMPQSRISNNSPSLIPQQKRKRYDEEGREKVKKMRRLGACFRCKIYKLPVGRRLRPIYSMTKMSG